MTLTKEEIIVREAAVFVEAIKTKQDPAWWIAQDRAKRWAGYLQTIVVRDDVVAWAAIMTASHRRFADDADGAATQAFDGATCRYYGNTCSWVVALLICRYGEAEYHWPVAGFTDSDVARAGEWHQEGKTPEGIVYL